MTVESFVAEGVQKKRKYSNKVAGNPVSLMRIDKRLVDRVSALVGELPPGFGKKTDTSAVHYALSQFVESHVASTPKQLEGMAYVRLEDVFVCDEIFKREIMLHLSATYPGRTWKDVVTQVIEEAISRSERFEEI